MKYIGRIIALIPIIVINVWLLKFTIMHDGVLYFLFSLILAIFSSLITWYLGGQFDKAKHYHKELLTSKEDLQKEKENLQEIFDSVDATFWSNDILNQRIFVSKGIEKITGYPVQRFFQDYEFWTSIFHPESRIDAIQFHERMLTGKNASFEGKFINSKGDSIWVYMSGSPVFSVERNEVIKTNGVVIDITDRKKTEEELQKSEKRYRNLVEYSPNIILIYQGNTIVYANQTAVKVSGIRYSELIGKSIFEFVEPSVKEQLILRNKRLHDKKTGQEIIEYSFKRADGSVVYVESIGLEIEHNDQPAIMAVGTDITAKKEYQEKIKFMAYHDALTQLPNRYMLTEYLETNLGYCERNNLKLAVILIDIDHFKFINDTMGHDTGDQLLLEISKRLRTFVREEDLVSRQGGDEFIILIKDTDESGIRSISERLIESLKQPFMINEKLIHTTASIGISLYPMDGQAKETLVSKADMAMYLAKKRGKNNYQFFHDHGEILDRQLKIEQDLGNALAKKQLHLVYQPCIELATGRIYCVEALIRWNHPVLGMVPPSEFIPIAEENGQIVQLGQWVLEEACRQNKAWQEAGIDIKMAINVSALQFEACNFAEVVKNTLRRFQLSPQLLELEITESLMQNIEKSSWIINELSDIGVRISIDDFGTGYSSLSVLSNLKIHHVKIDKSFINGIKTNKNNASLVKTMIEMGQNLNFDLIAEGIEEQNQEEFLIENGCQYGQGFYYSPPLAPNEVEKILTDNPWIKT